MNRAKAIILGVFALAVVAIVAITYLRPSDNASGDKSLASGSASVSVSAGGLAPTPKPPSVEISMLYGTEKKEWIEAAVQAFRIDRPDIKVTLIGRGSISGAQAIVDEKEKPTIFSPADSLLMAMATSDWRTKGKGDLVATSGDDAPQSLLLSPLVFIAWDDRAEALQKASKGSETITWRAIHKAVLEPKGWGGIGGKPTWGFVKLGHTDPTQSNSGLQVLYSMALEYTGKPQIEVPDLMSANFQKFVKEIEKGVSKFESSTGTFMTDMVRFGPSKYDVAVVYENLAISQVESAGGRWGNLRVYYPTTTIWADHPAAMLNGDWISEPQKQAARTWLSFLRGRAMQEKALAFGFRPGDPAVAVKTADAQNPFNRLAVHGIRIDVPTAAKTPDGAVVRNLLTMWTRVVENPAR